MRPDDFGQGGLPDDDGPGGLPGDFDPAELPDDLDPAERTALAATAARLVAVRPVPSPGFRGTLRRETLGRAGVLTRRPPRLRRRIVAFLVAGALPVVVAASGLTGSGPLAPPAADGATHAAQSPGTAEPPGASAGTAEGRDTVALPPDGGVPTAQVR